jgi:hypothetical protein
MSFKIKRDETTYNQPTLSQIEYGELLINVNTGILYTKRKNSDNSSTLIQYLPSVAPQGALTAYLPSIKFSETNQFCCNGSILTVTINNLIANQPYYFTISDMINIDNSTSFNTNSGQLLPETDSKREVSINISVSSSSPNALLKFSVYQGSISSENLKSENMLAICCDSNCGT